MSLCTVIKIVEVLAVRFRPFYILREFTAIIVIVIYIPSNASTNAKAGEVIS